MKPPIKAPIPVPTVKQSPIVKAYAVVVGKNLLDTVAVEYTLQGGKVLSETVISRAPDIMSISVAHCENAIWKANRERQS